MFVFIISIEWAKSREGTFELTDDGPERVQDCPHLSVRRLPADPTSAHSSLAATAHNGSVLILIKTANNGSKQPIMDHRLNIFVRGDHAFKYISLASCSLPENLKDLARGTILYPRQFSWADSLWVRVSHAASD